MLTVEEARERMLARFARLDAEDVPLTAALGRVLAGDAVARESLPRFTNSAMDGYAVRSADAQGASAEAPKKLRLAGEVPAGRVYQGTVSPGETVRILTGAPLPDGADAVLQQELTEVGEGWVRLLAEAPAGNNLRHPGEDVREGDVLVPGGVEISPAEIALLASAGVHPVRVTRRPRIAILSTGDELAPLGETPRPGQIRESNGPYLLAAVARAGAEPVALGIARDRAEELRAKLEQARGADLILYAIARRPRNCGCNGSRSRTRGGRRRIIGRVARDNVEPHTRGPCTHHTNRARCGVGKIDHALFYKRSAIGDANFRLHSVVEIRHAHDGVKRQCAVRRCQLVHVVDFAIRGAATVKRQSVPRCEALLEISAGNF